MSDSHRPFLSLGRARLWLLAVALVAIAVAAVVGLVQRTGTDSDGAAGGERIAARTSHVAASAGTAAGTRGSFAPSPDDTSEPVTAVPATTTPATTTPATATPTTPTAPKPPLTYVVKPGDNLSVIAAWFHLHGYGDLYDRNRAAIGDDPNLIHPGLRITVSRAGVSMSS